MVKYLSEISDRLNLIRKGLEKNMDKWSIFLENPSLIQAHMDAALFPRSWLQHVGIHADDPGKLVEYGINNNNSKSRSEEKIITNF